MKKFIFFISLVLVAAASPCSAEIRTLGVLPIGPSGAVQFNNAGYFGGSSSFTWSRLTSTLYATTASVTNLWASNLTVNGMSRSSTSYVNAWETVAGTMTVVGPVRVGSATSAGTVTSTSGFVGPGDRLTNLNVAGSPFMVASSNVIGGFTAGAVTAAYIVDLRISRDSANIVSSSAGAADVMGTVFVNIATRADISKVGAGGLDRGAEQASTWYSIFLISDGSQVGILLSSATGSAPYALPTGYTKWRRIGYAYNDGSNNFRDFFKRGRTVTYTDQVAALSTVSPATSLTDIFLDAYVSTTAVRVTLSVTAIETGGTICSMTLKPKKWPTSNEPILGTNVGGATDVRVDLIVEYLLVDGRTLEYKQNGTSSMDQILIYVMGYDED